MSNIAEPPFNEYEERYFLAEILKSSNLPPITLLNFINETGIDPAWNDIALPHGRSVSACRNAYQTLLARAPYIQDPRARRKRPLPMGEPTPTTERILQPRPSAFAPVNTPEQTSPVVLGDNGRPVKKRGRPSKEEFNRRVAEAKERGEVYQPKVRKKPQRPSTGGVETVEVAGAGAPTAVMFTPEKTIAPAAGSPGSSKKKQRPNSTLEEAATSTIQSAGQTQEAERRGVGGIASEQQIPSFGPREHLLAGLQEHATTTERPDVQMGESETSPAATSASEQRGYAPIQGQSFPTYHSTQPERRPGNLETPATTAS